MDNCLKMVKENLCRKGDCKWLAEELELQIAILHVMIQQLICITHHTYICFGP